MGRYSGTRSLLSGCSSASCSLAGRSHLTPYPTRSQHRTNERLQTRLVSPISWKLECFSNWGTREMLCASVRLDLIFCKVSLRLSVAAITCHGMRPTAVPPSFFIFFRCSSKLHSLSFFPHLLFFYAPVPLFLNSLSASVSFSPPLPSCACVCECDSVMCWIFLATNHSVKRWGETSGNVQPASSRIAGCAFPSFPLFCSFSFVLFFSPSLSHKKRYYIIRFWYWTESKLRQNIRFLFWEKHCITISSQTDSFKSRLPVVKLLIWLHFGFNQI